MSPTPQKRPRILAPESAESFIEKIDGETTYNRKFHLMQWNSTFQIIHLPANPEGLLAGIFQACIDSAIDESRTNEIEPEQMGFTVSSPLMDDLQVPFRPITSNTVDIVLNMFLKVAQSKEQLEMSLWGAPFSIKIATINKKLLPRERDIVGGGRHRKLAPVRHNIKKKALIELPARRDGRCLFRALHATFVHKTRGYDFRAFYNYRVGRFGMRGKLDKETDDLMRAIGVPMNLKQYDARVYVPLVVDYWNQIYEGHHKFKVFIFGSIGDFTPMYKYPDGQNNYDTPILLYFDDEHFQGIRKAHGMFDKCYCLSCESTYHSQNDHAMSCRARCRKCSQVGPEFPCEPLGGYEKKCQQCQKLFNNQQCYNYHVNSGFCNLSKMCEKCGIIWNVELNTRKGRKGHVCGETYCKRCDTYHDKERGCFIKVIEPGESFKSNRFRIVAVDMETMQNEPATIEKKTKQQANPSKIWCRKENEQQQQRQNLAQKETNKKNHRVNFISARIGCPECIENGQWEESLIDEIYECEVCGPNRTVTFGHRDFSDTRVDFHYQTDDPTAAFVDWILHDFPPDFPTYCYGHNAGRFDYMFICKNLYKEKLNPEMIRNGNKLYEMSVARTEKNPAVIFRDSYNLLHMPLATTVPSFDLNVMDKPFFPYLANREENYGVRMPQLPPKEEYLYRGFMPAKKKAFDEWYEQHKNEEFFLDEALAAYCCNDTDILMAALVAFRKHFMDISKRPPDEFGNADRPSLKPHDGIDPLRDCVTISSACLQHFRANHLKFNHMAIVPEKGYDSCETQSPVALKFLQWLAEERNVTIRTAHSEGGEKRIGRYKLDGWIEEEQRGIEVNGCPFHGCKHCYPNDDLLMPGGKTAGWLRQKDEERMRFLRSKVPVEVYWTCEIDQMLEENKEMAQKFEEYHDKGPIDLRKAFFGGRTGPMKLYHKVKPGEKISYLDFTSLYPYTNYTTNYPVGIPKVHIVNKKINWKEPEDILFPLSIIKAFVIPPKQCKVPVLPMKMEKDDRLLFPLCSKCCKENPKGAVNEEYSCQHNDEERGWVSICTSIEAAEALAAGYRFTELYRVLEYEQSDDQLFRSYVREFLTEKFHASGFDSTIKGNFEEEEKFIAECLEMFGIEIDREKMKTNKGRRALAKLCLNNLWGRFSLRNYGLSETRITDDPAELRRCLEDRSLDVTALDELDEETIMISFVRKRDWVKEGDASNVVISLWTTSQARILLLKAMQKVANTPGCEILYTDTDSIVFVEPENGQVLETSPHLGGLTSEIPEGYKVVEWVSGGAKQYGLKLKKIDAPEEENEFDYILKIRGMTLNWDVMMNQGLQYETFKESVLRYCQTGQPQPIHVLYPNFLRPNLKHGTVYTQPLQKIWKPFCGKGIVRPSDTRVLDFGYITPN